jgi:hypothetical protein
MENLPQHNRSKIKDVCLAWQKEPQKLYGQLEISEIKDAIKSTSPSIAVMRRELGVQSVKLILFIWIADLVQFFNVGKTMNEQQVGITVDLVLKRFFFLKPEDFKICFENAKSGNYGRLFDRLDGSIIIEWLSDYCSERINIFQQKSDNDHLRSKNVQVLPKEIVNVYTEIRTGIEAEHDKEEQFKEFIQKYNELKKLKDEK